MDVLINGEIILNGTVGSGLFDDGFTYRDVMLALAKRAGADTVVRINSGGGYADEGVAIYNALKMHKGKITVTVEGVAASSASIIAMAGEEITIRRGAIMMIHDPMVFAVGNAEDLERAIDSLEATATGMAQIYADQTGRSAEDCRAEMREELWMTGDEAVAKGYADRYEDATEAREVAAFDYRAYAHAPSAIVAMSDQRKWSHRLKAKTTVEHETMPTENTEQNAAAIAAAVKAESERAAAITGLCAAAGVASMAASFIRDGVTAEQAQTKIAAEAGRVKAIKEKVEQARKICPAIEASVAETYIAAGTNPESVADDLLHKIAQVSATTETRGNHNASPPNGQAAVQASWDKIVGKVNDRRFPQARH